MVLLTEIIEEKQKVLIVAHKYYPFIDLLKSELKKYGMEIFLSPRLPKNTERFNYCFSINLDKLPSADKIKTTHFVYIYFNQKKKIFPQKSRKIIDLTGNDVRKEDLEKILWFVFSKTAESYLHLRVSETKTHLQTVSVNLPLGFLTKFLTKKNLFISAIIIIFLFHLLFIFPFLISSYYLYQSVGNFKKNSLQQTKNLLNINSPLFNLSKKLYHLSRPTWLLFSLAFFPDNLMAVAESGNIALNQIVAAQENWQNIQKLLFEKNKSGPQRSFISLRFKKLMDQINIIDDNLNLLNQKLPNQIDYFKKIKDQLKEATDTVTKLKKILPYFDSLLAAETEKKYLLFFANNMELRPGGGFIGSFGILTVKDYTIDDLQIYDVYDADGQLTAHIEPPEPIRKYLNMPHWFLRDSNFSPDFLENYNQAKFFLEKEMGWRDFSGAILLTTTAIRNLLEAFGNIYLPDFNEFINAENFYIKTQIHVQKDFFPGSIQKKSFLAALTKQLFINLNSASIKKLAPAFKKSLDEKQVVFFFKDAGLQSVIDSAYWSGRMINPDCLPALPNCFSDYLLSYDANLGVNKVNFFISRITNLRINIDTQGAIVHKLSVLFKNDSPAIVFAGGLYRNYFQVIIPKNSKLLEITKNGVLVEDYKEEESEKLKTVGFLIEIEPKKIVEVKIIYQSKDKLPKGKSVYQLIVQKQIGSSNNDFSLDLNLGKNVLLINQNFSPLVKNNSILYNTSLSNDKIFFMEMIRE